MTYPWRLIVNPKTLPAARQMLISCRSTWPDLEIIADPSCPERSWRRRTFWEWLTRKQIEHPRVGYLMQMIPPQYTTTVRLP